MKKDLYSITYTHKEARDLADKYAKEMGLKLEVAYKRLAEDTLPHTLRTLQLEGMLDLLCTARYDKKLT